jgi:protein-S-isoprenylcysteine O-methyltransferase Ste14
MQAGSRGGAWVVAQFVLIGLTVLGAFVPPRWPEGARGVLGVVGTALVVAGAALAAWAYRKLGPAFTPFPRPLAEGKLVELGPYAFVRHPMYAAGLAFFGGFALWTSVPAGVLAAALAVLWALKARVEERLLRERFAAYGQYAARVRWRLLPGVY